MFSVNNCRCGYGNQASDTQGLCETLAGAGTLSVCYLKGGRPSQMKKWVRKTGVLQWLLIGLALLGPGKLAAVTPVLVYHRFGATVADSMTVTTAVFETQFRWLQDNGYTLVPLRQLVDYRLGKGPPPPKRAVIITADDGHVSVYTQLLPLIRRYRFPVTLFIYPSAISNARYALTWAQLAELKATGLVDIQSHSYWHPHFPKEKRRLSPAAYASLVQTQLSNSKRVLEQRLGGQVDLLAWPFGLYDAELMERARGVGYVAAFTLEGRAVEDRDPLMALPRFLITNVHQGAAFAHLLAK